METYVTMVEATIEALSTELADARAAMERLTAENEVLKKDSEALTYLAQFDDMTYDVMKGTGREDRWLVRSGDVFFGPSHLHFEGRLRGAIDVHRRLIEHEQRTKDPGAQP